MCFNERAVKSPLHAHTCTHTYIHTYTHTLTYMHTYTHTGRATQRPASASAAAPSVRAAQGNNGPSNNQQSFHLTIKATLGNESKLVATPLNVSYYELLQAVKAKYPDAGGCWWEHGVGYG